jgi:hypothetical protein
LQVVVVSANATPAGVARARELGALKQWDKPLKLETFFAGISRLLELGNAEGITRDRANRQHFVTSAAKANTTAR